jgi:glycosyltransferase involved in cell wall biosynthesis
MMNIAYLMNTYPITSTTFVRNEILALEKRGIKITRYAIRTWSENLVEPADIQEKRATKYILSNNVLGLVTAVITEMIANPKGFFKAFVLLWKLIKNAKGSIVPHLAYFLEASFLHQQTRKDGVDHVHAHFSTNSTAVAMLSHRMGGPSYSFTAHGPYEFDAPVHASLAEKIADAKFVVAISDYCKSQLIRFSGFKYWDKIYVFRCGVAIEDFIYSSHQFEDNFQLVCVGRLCDEKGQLLLPGVASALKQRFPKLKIVLIGDGNSRTALEENIESLQVESVIDLKGWLSNSDVRQLISQSRALILPSFAEGLPIVFMEALALGRPVLGTYIAGIPELVDEQCGWIIPAGSQQQLESAIAEILNSTPADLAIKGKEGRERIEKLHDLAALAVSLHNAFLSVVSNE